MDLKVDRTVMEPIGPSLSPMGIGPKLVPKRMAWISNRTCGIIGDPNSSGVQIPKVTQFFSFDPSCSFRNSDQSSPWWISQSSFNIRVRTDLTVQIKTQKLNYFMRSKFYCPDLFFIWINFILCQTIFLQIAMLNSAHVRKWGESNRV